MDEIKLQLETVCLVSIFAGLISVAIPQGKMKNAFSGFCAAVIIFSSVAPVVDIKTQGLSLFSFAAARKDEMLLSDVRTAETDLYENILSSALKNELEKRGCKVEVKAYCEKADDEIRVISFEIKGSLDEKLRTEAQEYLKNGFPGVEIKFEEENNG